MARLRPRFNLGLYANARIDEALLRTQKIQAIERPSPRSQRNVHNLIHNTQSLVYDEAYWIREGTDLAALGYAADRGWLNTFLEDLLNTVSRTVTGVCIRHYLSNIFVPQQCQLDMASFPVPTIIHRPISSLSHTLESSYEVLPLIFVNRRSSALMSRKSRLEMRHFTWSLWTASTMCSAPSSLY